MANLVLDGVQAGRLNFLASHLLILTSFSLPLVKIGVRTVQILFQQPSSINESVGANVAVGSKP